MSPLGHRPPTRRWTPLQYVPPRPRFSLWTFKGHIHTMHSNRNCIKSELVMVTVFHCIGKKKVWLYGKKSFILALKFGLCMTIIWHIQVQLHFCKMLPLFQKVHSSKNKRFMLEEMTYWKASKFAIFLEYKKPMKLH